MLALMMADHAHLHDGKPAYTVAVHDAASGRNLGSYVLVLTGCGSQQYILPDGQVIDSRRHTIDDVLGAITRNHRQEVAA